MYEASILTQIILRLFFLEGPAPSGKGYETTPAFGKSRPGFFFFGCRTISGIISTFHDSARTENDFSPVLNVRANSLALLQESYFKRAYRYTQ